MARATRVPERLEPATRVPERLAPAHVGVIGLEGLGLEEEMDDQHGIGTCAEAETSVSVGRGREHAEARCYAQRGAAKKCAAGLLLLASVECVGWARLQGTEYRRAQSHRLRRAERKEGLCWRRRPQPTYAHTRMPASPSAQSRHPKTHGKACERIACAL